MNAAEARALVRRLGCAGAAAAEADTAPPLPDEARSLLAASGLLAYRLGTDALPGAVAPGLSMRTAAADPTPDPGHRREVSGTGDQLGGAA